MKKILLSLTALPFAIGACGGNQEGNKGTEYNLLDFNHITWFNAYTKDSVRGWIDWKNEIDFTDYSDTWEYLKFDNNHRIRRNDGYKNTIIYNFTGREDKAKSMCDKYVSTLKTSDNESGIVPPGIDGGNGSIGVSGYGTNRVMFITSFDAENKIFRGLSVRGKNYIQPNNSGTEEIDWRYKDELIEGYCETEETFEPLNVEGVQLIRNGYGDIGSPYAEKYLLSRFDSSAVAPEKSIFYGDELLDEILTETNTKFPRIRLMKTKWEHDSDYRLNIIVNKDKI